MAIGYYRFPTIYDDTIVFVSEDDLWAVPTTGGLARRLTSNLGNITFPMFSPDGEWLAFVGREEGGPEVFVMPASGGSARRLTFLNSGCRVLGWTPDGKSVLFASNYGQMTRRAYAIFSVDVDENHGTVTQLPFGPAQSISFGPNGALVLGRNMGEEFAHWKRYRGGTTGQLWIDRTGDGQFVRLLDKLVGHVEAPLWLHKPAPAGRIFLVSDHEGVGNLYSCQPDGNDLQRHTDYDDFYVRNPTTDGQRIVFHAGADLFVYDVAADRESRVEIDYRSPRVQRNRRFVDAWHYADGYTMNPTGRALTLTTRGKLFTLFHHDGPVVQLGKRDGVRYRLANWLNDNRRIVVLSDEPGDEVLELYRVDPPALLRRYDGLDIGRVIALEPSPTQDKLALTNYRNELMVLDLPSGECTVADHSPFAPLSGIDWSPDGKWLAYSAATTSTTWAIRLYRLPDPDAEKAELRMGSVHTVTQPILRDFRPAFDPDGRFLYFLSIRDFSPVRESVDSDLSFPRGVRPYLILLRTDLPNPFQPRPDLEEEEVQSRRPIEEPTPPPAEPEIPPEPAEDEDATTEEAQATSESEATPENPSPPPSEPAPSVTNHSAPKANNQPRTLQIDLDGIEHRILAFPVHEGRYSRIAGLPGRALFVELPVRGGVNGQYRWDDSGEETGLLHCYHFKEHRSEVLIDNIQNFELSRNRKKLLYWNRNRLRVINAGEKPPTDGSHPRRTGVIDLSRVRVSVDPQSEWEQMFREAWRLQRDFFWTADMAEVDWAAIYERYFPLIRRVNSRTEFSDLMWEMQSELGTSHAYESGGDYRARPYYSQGFLGASFTWDVAARGYRVGEIVRGDSWDSESNSPLAAPGLDVQAGDLLVAINGTPLDEQIGPAQLLVNQARQEVQLTFAPRPATARGERTYVVRTLADETPARYRAWVEANRQWVHSLSNGRIGYVHIPDMKLSGYAEFHRGYLAEVTRDALIIDVRYNSGGNVSGLILEKLARQRIGYSFTRWNGLSPYLDDSPAGPLVALTNEHAISDGDIFCHSFKLLKLGPLIGKRTWGGVIGYFSGRPRLVDSTRTTQPEASHWFVDVGWNVENYGTEPDIEVEIAPQDYAQGQDVQLQRALEVATSLLEQHPIPKPDVRQRPSRASPKLPPRNSSSTSA